MKRRMISEIISVLYVSLMLYTAISKLKDTAITREQMAMMPLLEPIAPVVVWLLPLIEVCIAILIFIPKYRLRGLYIVTCLMVSFSLYIIYMMIFYSNLPCSCGGLIDKLNWPEHLVFNGVFIALGLIAIRLNRLKSHNESNAPAIG